MSLPSPNGHPERSEAKSRDLTSQPRPPHHVRLSGAGTGSYWIYMLTNDRRTTLYIGITNSLEARLWQHAQGIGSEFTRKYKLHVLVYYENYSDPAQAIAREKQLKNWSRAKKEGLIARINPKWCDLGRMLFGDAQGSLRGPSTSLRSARDDHARGS